MSEDEKEPGAQCPYHLALTPGTSLHMGKYMQVCSCVCEMGLHWIGHAIYNNCCNIGLFNVDLS